MGREWCSENYSRSITSIAWAGTPYDDEWEGIQGYPELRAIFQKEMALGTVPEWAAKIVERMIGPLPICGHYTFPRPLLQACQAIGEEDCLEFVCGCYTADSKRKVLMSYYVYCLDAWLKGAPLEIATAELAIRDGLGRDWPEIIAAIYESLGPPSEGKKLLIERLVHRLRWWVKTLIWFDDGRDRYMLDLYSGDARGDEAKWGAYGNAPFGDPFFAERNLPQMKALAERIREVAPEGEKLLDRIECTWLCAPKSFRYLERLVLEIGSLDPSHTPTSDGTILRCEDTYPDVSSCERWYLPFMSSLAAWLEGNREALAELGEPTPVKRWLVRLFHHKLRLYEEHCNFGKLVGARPSGKRGTRTI